MEEQGLVIWTASIVLMEVVVIINWSRTLNALIVIIVAALNIVHYINILLLVVPQFRRSLVYAAYQYAYGAVDGVLCCRAGIIYLLLKWPWTYLIGRDAKCREGVPRVFINYTTGYLDLRQGRNRMNTRTISCCPLSVEAMLKSLSLGGRAAEVGVGVGVMRMTAHAMQDAIELLQIHEIPPDLSEFFWSQAFLFHALRMKIVKDREDPTKDRMIVMPHPIEDSKQGFRQMSIEETSQAMKEEAVKQASLLLQVKAAKAAESHGERSLHNAGRIVSPVDLPDGSTDSTAYQAAAEGQCRTRPIIVGVPLDDFELNLSYVVDELVTRQQQHEETLRGQRLLATTEGVAREDDGKPGGWMGLYLAFRQAKQKLIQTGTDPEDVPAALATYASQKDYIPLSSPHDVSQPRPSASNASITSEGSPSMPRCSSPSMQHHPFSSMRLQAIPQPSDDIGSGRQRGSPPRTSSSMFESRDFKNFAEAVYRDIAGPVTIRRTIRRSKSKPNWGD
ncbi:unnamed protein product [Vitrella brassicaformis CCMP3155]|uniref:Uncharacterized protein n=2 Tax=Vitrella brassicaformis TaxID=1169539 RepID=A0A0G4E9V7_VITBC|nr:unnamed protein product [Vitrella brassicaformis CCMP3155]|eukprot:CEL92707.1 unnamed protein product [Vitrella brassicaformis CCMP3155]